MDLSDVYVVAGYAIALVGGASAARIWQQKKLWARALVGLYALVVLFVIVYAVLDAKTKRENISASAKVQQQAQREQQWVARRSSDIGKQLRDELSRGEGLKYEILNIVTKRALTADERTKYDKAVDVWRTNLRRILERELPCTEADSAAKYQGWGHDVLTWWMNTIDTVNRNVWAVVASLDSFVRKSCLSREYPELRLPRPN